MFYKEETEVQGEAALHKVAPPEVAHPVSPRAPFSQGREWRLRKP